MLYFREITKNVLKRSIYSKYTDYDYICSVF